MPRKRQDEPIKFELDIWIKEKDLYRADIEKLKAAIQASPNNDETIRKRMGRGYESLEKALNGELLTIWNAKHVEWGLTGAS